jgi:hypothetical protein
MSCFPAQTAGLGHVFQYLLKPKRINSKFFSRLCLFGTDYPLCQLLLLQFHNLPNRFFVVSLSLSLLRVRETPNMTGNIRALFCLAKFSNVWHWTQHDDVPHACRTPCTAMYGQYPSRPSPVTCCSACCCCCNDGSLGATLASGTKAAVATANKA